MIRFFEQLQKPSQVWDQWAWSTNPVKECWYHSSQNDHSLCSPIAKLLVLLPSSLSTAPSSSSCHRLASQIAFPHGRRRSDAFAYLGSMYSLMHVCWSFSLLGNVRCVLVHQDCSGNHILNSSMIDIVVMELVLLDLSWNTHSALHVCSYERNLSAALTRNSKHGGHFVSGLLLIYHNNWVVVRSYRRQSWGHAIHSSKCPCAQVL